jgi:hypothetical protein
MINFCSNKNKLKNQSLLLLSAAQSLDIDKNFILNYFGFKILYNN